LLNVDKNRDYKKRGTVYSKGSRSCIEKMLKGHVIRENSTLDFTNNPVYLDSNTVK
jgi:hypothetical protein